MEEDLEIVPTREGVAILERASEGDTEKGAINHEHQGTTAGNTTVTHIFPFYTVQCTLNYALRWADITFKKIDWEKVCQRFMYFFNFYCCRE